MSILSQIAAGAAKRNTGGGIGGAVNWLSQQGNKFGDYLGRQPGVFRASARNEIAAANESRRVQFGGAPRQAAGFRMRGSMKATPASATPFKIPGLPGSGIPLAAPIPNAYDQYAGMLNVGFQNQIGNYDAALQRSQTGFDLRNAGYNNVESGINQGLALNIEGLGLDRMATEINRQANLGDQNAIAQQRIINAGMNENQRTQLANQESMLTELYGQAGVTSSRETARAAQMLRDETRRSISEQSAMGATSTTAARENARLSGEATDDRIAQIREGYAVEGTRFRGALADIESGRDRLNWDLRNSNLDLDTQSRNLTTRASLLAIEAARYNVSERQLRQAAEQQLAQIGLDRAVSFGQLLEAQSSRDINVANAATQFIQNIANFAASRPA